MSEGALIFIVYSGSEWMRHFHPGIRLDAVKRILRPTPVVAERFSSEAALLALRRAPKSALGVNAS